MHLPQVGDIILACPPVAIKSGIWRNEEISYTIWCIKRGRVHSSTPTNQRRITGQDHTEIGGWGSPRQKYAQDHTQKLRLGTLSSFENTPVWIIVFITSLGIMINKLSITLLSSLLDSSCCRTKSCLVFPADWNRRSTTSREEEARPCPRSFPRRSLKKNTHRLPPKDVGRCRAISMSWGSEASTTGFFHEHHGC